MTYKLKHSPEFQHTRVGWSVSRRNRDYDLQVEAMTRVPAHQGWLISVEKKQRLWLTSWSNDQSSSTPGLVDQCREETRDYDLQVEAMTQSSSTPGLVDQCREETETMTYKLNQRPEFQHTRAGWSVSRRNRDYDLQVKAMTRVLAHRGWLISVEKKQRLWLTSWSKVLQWRPNPWRREFQYTRAGWPVSRRNRDYGNELLWRSSHWWWEFLHTGAGLISVEMKQRLWQWAAVNTQSLPMGVPACAPGLDWSVSRWNRDYGNELQWIPSHWRWEFLHAHQGWMISVEMKQRLWLTS